jgi:DNA-binding SARP family transcriptional activator
VLRLLTFGGPGLVHDDGSVAPRVRPPRLALLAALAAAGERGVTRDRLMALLWPDSDDARGRHSLRQSLYTLRQELGRDVVLARGAALVLDDAAVASDIADFRAALARDDRRCAVAIASKPFLDGFYLPGAPDFERWVEAERARFATMVTGALHALAREASDAGDRRAAVEWWRQLVALDPLSGHVAAGYAQALATDGDRARALDFVRRHEALVRRELDAEPDAEVRRLGAKLRSERAPRVEPSGPEANPLATSAAASESARARRDSPELAPAVPSVRWQRGVRRWAWAGSALILPAVVTTAALARQGGWLATPDGRPPVSIEATRVSGDPDALPRAQRSSIAEPPTSSPLAYRLFEEGVRAYSRFDTEAAHQLMHSALEEDSTFAMAAYYEAKLASNPNALFDGRTMGDVRARALRLAERAPDRDRLTITAELLRENNEPRALAVAESLAARYPTDPQALMALARARNASGDWSGAVQPNERAIMLDSAAGGPSMPLETNCRLCQDMGHLMEIYFWSDSLAAVERVAHRLARIYPTSFQSYYALAIAAARRGDSTRANAWFRRLSATGSNRLLRLRLDLTLEDYDAVERDARSFLAASFPDEWQQGVWNYLIALRNQGRLREASLLHRTGYLPGMPAPTVNRGVDGYNDAILALERGDPRTTARVLETTLRLGAWSWSPGLRARHKAWHATLQGMALAAAGDTVAVRALADSVEGWGRASLFGRDRRLHHYLRGLVLTAAGRCNDATREYRDAMVWPSLGFTRVNYELGRCLIALGRPHEAVAVLQPALRGEVDASNLYVTRTDLHELLARAFDATGASDSAAFHYRAVVKAWSRADPAFHTRRSEAHRWLARVATPPVPLGDR